MTPCLFDVPAAAPILDDPDDIAPYEALLENFVEEVCYDLRRHRAFHGQPIHRPDFI